jgi:hypothetical protein
MRQFIILFCLLFFSDAFVSSHVGTALRAQSTAEGSKKKNTLPKACRNFSNTEGDMRPTTSSGGVLKFNYVSLGERKCDRGKGYWVRCVNPGRWAHDGADDDCNSSSGSGVGGSGGAADVTGNPSLQGTDGHGTGIPPGGAEVFCVCSGFNGTSTDHFSRIFTTGSEAACSNSGARFRKFLGAKRVRVSTVNCFAFNGKKSASDYVKNYQRRKRTYSGVFGREIGEKGDRIKAELAKYPCVYREKVYKRGQIVRGPINFSQLLNYGRAVYKSQRRNSPGCHCVPHDRSVKGWYCY